MTRSEYTEMKAWLEAVGDRASGYADRIEHKLVPAGTETLEIDLKNLVKQAQKAADIAGVVIGGIPK